MNENANDLPQKNVNIENLQDETLFRQAMKDVTPLSHRHKHLPYDHLNKTKQAKSKLRQRQFENYRQLANQFPELKKKIIDSSQPVQAFDEVQEFDQGLRPQDLRRLKNGNFTLEAQLDLHGQTKIEAEIAIERFIQQALACQMRFIRIVHGKGYNSQSDLPVLKNLCFRMLKEMEDIVAFCSAAEKHGGTGAINIQLRNR